MKHKTLNLELSRDQLADLTNALEDHRDYFKKCAEEARFGLGLDIAYWQSRAGEVQELLHMVRDSTGQEHR